MKILEVMTEHTAPFKVLIEVLKEMLPETNIEFMADPEYIKKLKNGEGSEESSDNEAEEEDEEEGDDARAKSKKKDVVKKKGSEGGMRIMAVDTTKSVLINLKLDAKNFTKFKCKKKKVTLGVNLAYFHKLIKTMEKDDNLTLYVDHDELNFLKIKIDNPEEKKDSMFELKLLDLNEDPMVVPDISFDAVVTMSSSEFHKICREMSQIAEYVEIQCSNNKIIFICKGDYAKRRTTYRTGADNEEGDGISIKLAGKGKDNPVIVQGIYELKNLILFAKCASLCNDIEIYLKNNYPLVIKYTVATLGRILLCLTPIQEDAAKNGSYSDDEDYYSDDDVQLKKKN
jgi:proliferating cell nuclear antigen